VLSLGLCLARRSKSGRKATCTVPTVDHAGGTSCRCLHGIRRTELPFRRCQSTSAALERAEACRTLSQAGHTSFPPLPWQDHYPPTSSSCEAPPAPVDPKVIRGIICAAFAERQLTSEGGSSNILRRASVLAVTRLSHVDPPSLEVCDLADAAFISPGTPPQCCLEAATGSSGLADCSGAGSEDCAFALPAASACADDACCLLAASAWKVLRLPACHSETELLVGESPGLSLSRCAIMASASIWLARRTRSVADMSLLPLGSARGTSGMVVPPDMDVCRLGALLELRLPFMARSGSFVQRSRIMLPHADRDGQRAMQTGLCSEVSYSQAGGSCHATVGGIGSEAMRERSLAKSQAINSWLMLFCN